MTLKAPETLIAIADTIASGIMSYSKASTVNGVSPRTFWTWIKASQSGDPEFIIPYLGEDIQFAKAINAARRMALHEMRGRMEQKSIFGYDEKVFFQGQPTFVEMEECVGLDEETRWMLGYPRDGLLRDEFGRRVQHTVHHEAPIALQLRVAEMAFPSEYRPGTNSSVDVRGNINAVVGVAYIKPASGPPTIPPPPPLPQLEVLSEADQLAIPETDDKVEPEADDMVEPAPMVPQAPGTVPVPEPVIKAPTPSEYQGPGPNPLIRPRDGSRPLSELEKSLLSALPSSIARAK